MYGCNKRSNSSRSSRESDLKLKPRISGFFSASYNFLILSFNRFSASLISTLIRSKSRREAQRDDGPKVHSTSIDQLFTIVRWQSEKTVIYTHPIASNLSGLFLNGAEIDGEMLNGERSSRSPTYRLASRSLSRRLFSSMTSRRSAKTCSANNSIS